MGARHISVSRVLGNELLSDTIHISVICRSVHAGADPDIINPQAPYRLIDTGTDYISMLVLMNESNR